MSESVGELSEPVSELSEFRQKCRKSAVPTSGSDHEIRVRNPTRNPTENGHAAPSLCAKLYVGTPRFFTTHRISTIVRTRLWHDESAKRLNRIEHVAVEVLNPWCEWSHVLHHRLG